MGLVGAYTPTDYYPTQLYVYSLRIAITYGKYVYQKLSKIEFCPAAILDSEAQQPNNVTVGRVQ